MEADNLGREAARPMSIELSSSKIFGILLFVVADFSALAF